MKHTIQRLILTMLVTFVSLSSSAYDFEVDGMYYDVVSLSDLTCELTSNPSVKYIGDITIPSEVTYNGKKLCVIRTDDGAFYKCVDLTSVVIEEGVQSIGHINTFMAWECGAFYGCTNLKTVKIPNSVKWIGDNAFSGCTSLTSIDISDSVTYLGHDVFKDCTSLEYVKLSNCITEIHENAFYGCSSLTSVEIPNSVKSIDIYAFYGCNSLTSIEIPNSVRSISKGTFYGCSSLSSVVIPDSVTNINEDAFKNCTNLSSVFFGENRMSIGDEAFANCISLTSVDIPKNVDITYESFYHCYNLSHITIRKSLYMEYLIGYAKTIVIAEDYSDTSLPDIKYNNCNKLDTIICKLNTPPTLYDNFSNSQYMNLKIVVPTESLTAYQSADVWKNFWFLQGGAENDISGISNIMIDENGKPSAIYDLQGRRLRVPQKGLNIINGKKVLVK